MKNSADLGGCYPPRPSASVDNTLLDLQNSSYPTRPHSIIAKYRTWPIGHSKEIRKLTFRELALGRSESRNCGLWSSKLGLNAKNSVRKIKKRWAMKGSERTLYFASSRCFFCCCCCFFFSRAIFRAVPWLTEHMEEANRKGATLLVGAW